MPKPIDPLADELDELEASAASEEALEQALAPDPAGAVGAPSPEDKKKKKRRGPMTPGADPGTDQGYGYPDKMQMDAVSQFGRLLAQGLANLFRPATAEKVEQAAPEDAETAPDPENPGEEKVEAAKGQMVTCPNCGTQFTVGAEKPKEDVKMGDPRNPAEEPVVGKDPGEFSVAQSATGGDKEMTPEELKNAIAGVLPDLLKAALEPFSAQMAASQEMQKGMQAQIEALQSSRQTETLAPLAKSLGLPVSTLAEMKKGMPEESFKSATDQLARWRQAALAGTFFTEIGTGAAPDPNADSVEVLLSKKADELRKANPKLGVDAALIEASGLLNLGLEPAPVLRG